MTIRILEPSDDRSAFESGDIELDRFFRRYAGQNQFRHHIGATYVFVEDGEIGGYATVAPATIEARTLPKRLSKGLPKYPLPVLRLARLAVDHRHRSKRIGAGLLRHATQLTLRMSEQLGAIGMTVDAKPGAAEFYARFGFEALDVEIGALAERPVPTTMFLAVRLIAHHSPSGA